MNFGAFTQSLKKSAALAAEAAQNLDFDKMAANDAYIHSEDLNVPRRKSPVDPPVDDESTLSTHSSLLDRSRNLLAGPPVPSETNPRFPNSRRLRNLVPLKVDVPERQPRIPEDSLSSEEDEDDPILALLKRDDHSKPMERPEASATGSGSTEVKKHRFFEDLESRIALPEKEMPDLLPSVDTTRDPGPSVDHFAPAAAQLPRWLSAAATTLRLPKPKTIMDVGDTVRPAFFRKKPEPARDELSNVAIVSGAAVLGEAELEELAAFGKRQEQNQLYFLMEVVTHHPRELFILFTLVLGGFVYLFARNRSWGV